MNRRPIASGDPLDLIVSFVFQAQHAASLGRRQQSERA